MRDSRVEVTIRMGGSVPLHKSLHRPHKFNFSNKDNFSLQQRYKVWCVCSYMKILADQVFFLEALCVFVKKDQTPSDFNFSGGDYFLSLKITPPPPPLERAPTVAQYIVTISLI